MIKSVRKNKTTGKWEFDYKDLKGKRKIKKGEIDMLNEEICKLRDKLNKSIENGEDYSITYKLSIELDELIAQYYRNSKNNKKKLVTNLI